MKSLLFDKAYPHILSVCDTPPGCVHAGEEGKGRRAREEGEDRKEKLSCMNNIGAGGLGGGFGCGGGGADLPVGLLAGGSFGHWFVLPCLCIGGYSGGGVVRVIN